MQKNEVTLSVYYDGQFFVALFERTDARGYSAARRVFAVKPSDEEIFEMICEGFYQLRFSAPIRGETVKVKMRVNPKRAQRNAAKAMRRVGSSTKAQAALQAERETIKTQRHKQSRAEKELYAQHKFALRQEKRKAKHRGH